MSKYLKYAVLVDVRLTQLDETINQLKTIKYPTKIIRDLIEHLTWVKKDFPITTKELPKTYNQKNIQIQIDFYDL